MADKNDLIRGTQTREAEEASDDPFPTEGTGGVGTPREQWESARLDAGGHLSKPGPEPSGTSAGDAAAEQLAQEGRTPADGTGPAGA